MGDSTYLKSDTSIEAINDTFIDPNIIYCDIKKSLYDNKNSKRENPYDCDGILIRHIVRSFPGGF